MGSPWGKETKEFFLEKAGVYAAFLSECPWSGFESSLTEMVRLMWVGEIAGRN